MAVSDSRWHSQLSELGESPVSGLNPYWLGPFQNYKTFCPYLVGSYDDVGRELSRYIALGFETFILDVPASAEELEHISADCRGYLLQLEHEGILSPLQREIVIDRLLALDGDEVWLEVRDNGRGFVLAQVPAGGNGLENMRARLAEDGGRTLITSEPGQGTRVRFVFPTRA